MPRPSATRIVRSQPVAGRTFASGKMDLEKCLHVCADELKIGGMDIIDMHLKSTDPDYLLKIKTLATDLQITISAVSPGNSFGAFNLNRLKPQ